MKIEIMTLNIREHVKSEVFRAKGGTLLLTTKQLAEKLGVTYNQLHYKVKESIFNKDKYPNAYGHKMVIIGYQYYFELKPEEYAMIQPRPKRQKYTYQEAYVRKLTKLREKSAARKALREAERARVLAKVERDKAEWAKFCLTPIHETWKWMQQGEVSEHLVEFLRNISFIEAVAVTKKKFVYKATITQMPVVGEALVLEVGSRTKPIRSQIQEFIPVFNLWQHFWIYKGSLVYFNGLNPDKTPCNPQILAIERHQQTKELERKFKPPRITKKQSWRYYNSRRIKNPNSFLLE